MNNEPYLENACCINRPKQLTDSKIQTSVEFFIAKKPDIIHYNRLVAEYAAIIHDIDQYIKSPQLWCPLNDKIIYAPMPSIFSEKTIYNAFVSFCNFRNYQPIPTDLMPHCVGKLDNIHINDTLNEMIIKLKNAGRNYTYDSLLQFLQIIHYKNILPISIQQHHISPIKQLKNAMPFIEHNMLDNAISINVGIKKRFIDLLNAVLTARTQSDTLDGVVPPAMEHIKALNNFLLTQNPIMKNNIIGFISQNAQNKINNITRTDIRHITDFLDGFQDWKMDDEIETTNTNTNTNNGIGIGAGNIYNRFEFISSFIKNMVLIFPQYLLDAKWSSKDVSIPVHWELAENHQLELQEIIKKYYAPLYKVGIIFKMSRILQTIPVILHSISFLCDKTKRLFISERTGIYLCEYYVLQVLSDYITLSERDDMFIVSGKKRTNTMAMDEINDTYSNQSLSVPQIPQYFEEDQLQMNDMVYQGNRKTLRANIACLITIYIDMMTRHKNIMNVSNKDIKEIVYKTQEREKEILTDRLKMMSDEERAVDKMFQKNKIGDIWGKGLQKGFVEYSRDEYENPKERAFVNEMQQFEKNIQNARGPNGGESFEDYMERKLYNEEIDREAYEIEQPEDGEGDEDGDYNNVDYEDYNQGYD
jgi:hypothetical protein